MFLDSYNKKIGILGGGQLGKMLLQAASKFSLSVHIMDNDAHCPAAGCCNTFHKGDITEFQDVLNFGRQMDVITIEIENVNVEALEVLQSEGKQVFPQPDVLRIIKDKYTQKKFYETSGFPTTACRAYTGKDEILQAVAENHLQFPFVQKSRRDGYDGKGVHIVRTADDLPQLLPGDTMVEDLAVIEKEIAVIVARGPQGGTAVFPAVEMQFHPTANLVEYLFSPSDISHSLETSAQQLAVNLADTLKIVGLLAVEMFITTEGSILINEVAPRPHNSGHHTIEACDISQYEMHLRAILNMPLVEPILVRPSVMVNLLGEEGHAGPAYYDGLDACLSVNGVYAHIYGKKETRPFRKMGHVTIAAESLAEARERADFVRKTLKVITRNGKNIG
jgi:5-(carboxyamino)imidazole ribonucleotide synthase